MTNNALHHKFHPVLSFWFRKKFGQATPIQEEAWASITKGDHTLIASPTGSGKTLAALLPVLDRILKGNNSCASKASGVKAIYITPLKALNNDIHHHIIQYVEEMAQAAAEQGVQWPGIRIAVRTGDTTASTRASMLRNPPDLLITTPESLYILLTSQKAREMLKTTEQVIVDEIHDLAGSRRGAHLSITLERLVEWCGQSPQRIGVSATQKPLDRVARFLSGWERNRPRPVTVVENHSDKKINLQIVMPKHDTISADKENFWTPLIDQLMNRINDCATALIFVNNRRLCERLALRLNDHVGYEMARSHHGSVSREKRLEIEHLLKTGEIKWLVATSSLELGIDVGQIDLVLQIDSPKQAATGIQRIGRAGHFIDGVSRGVIVAKNRSELLEITVLGRLIADRDIEEIQIPRHCLDVISQQVVAMVACENWQVEVLHEVITRSDSFREFSLQRLQEMLKVLSGFYPFVSPLLDWDHETGELKSRKNTSMAALMGAGTIPQGSNYPVHHADSRIHLGELDEEYVYESRVGDVFQLGASSWKIQSITNHGVYVTESANRFSEIPFWKGEANGRSFELGQKIGCFLEEIIQRMNSASEEELLSWLKTNYFLDSDSANELVRSIKQQMRMSQVPTHRCLVIEYFQDEINYTHLMIYSLYGRRFNRTWMLALQHIFKKRTNGKFYAYAKDNGIEFIFAEWDPGYMQCIRDVTAQTLEEILLEVIPSSPQFGITFRRMAEMSLLLARSFKRTPAALKRLRSEELLKASLPYAEHFPLIREATHDCLHEQMDMQHLCEILKAVQNGEIRVVIKETAYPLPFARMIMSDFIEGKIYDGEAIGKDLQLQLLSINRDLAVEWFGDNALKQAITPEAIAAEKERLEQSAASRVEGAEDLYRMLKKRGDLSREEMERIVGEPAGKWIDELNSQKRLISIQMSGQERWICRDEEHIYGNLLHDELAVYFVLSRFIESRLSFTEKDLAERYALPSSQVEAFIRQCEEKSLIDKAPFADEDSETTWISKSVLSRLIRSSVQSFHEEAEAVHSEQYLQEMLTLHHLTPETRRRGTEGLKQVIEHLQGLFLPLSQWEKMIFPSRVMGYRKEDLDQLCASGEVIWFGEKKAEEKEGRVAFFLAEAKDLYAPYFVRKKETKHPELFQLLRQKGALYLTAITRELDLLPSQALDMLFDLVWEGHASNDHYAPLRQNALTRSKKSKPAHSGFGRWYSLDSIADFDPARTEESSMMNWIQHSLRRNGVVCKYSIDESCPYSRDTTLGSLKQLEAWGMVMRGLFIRDIASIQFATREFIEKIRSGGGLMIDSADNETARQVTLLPAVDPANPYGTFMEWPELNGISFSRKMGNYIVIYKGQWIMWIENKGKRVHVLTEQLLKTDNDKLLERMLRDIFKSILELEGLRKITIDSWDGKPVQDVSAAAYLSALGAEKDRSSYVLWPSNLQ
jgi:ATP-dependent Lhr-like helicase